MASRTRRTVSSRWRVAWPVRPARYRHGSILPLLLLLLLFGPGEGRTIDQGRVRSVGAGAHLDVHEVCQIVEDVERALHLFGVDPFAIRFQERELQPVHLLQAADFP